MTKHLRRLAVLPAAGVLALGIAGPASAHVTVTRVRDRGRRLHRADRQRPARLRRLAHDEDRRPAPREHRGGHAHPQRAVRRGEGRCEQLDEPITGSHGEEITERVAQVVYTAKTPLPDGQRDAFELSLQIPEDAAGQTLAFPTIQTCEQGETAWTEIPADGPVRGRPREPGAGVRGDRGGRRRRARLRRTPPTRRRLRPPRPSPWPTTRARNTLGVLGLVAGLLGLALGGLALARTRGRA